MSSLNRTVAPQTSILTKVQLPAVEEITLDNALKVYAIQSNHEILKVDFIFEAGKWYEEKNLLADFACKMMKEGTHSKTSHQINDFLDFYGCNLEEQVYFSNAGFQLYSLTKNLVHVLPLMKELLTEPSFPEKELSIQLENRKEQHLQSLAKNDYLSNRMFLSSMWGNKHPYGRVTEEHNFTEITQADVSNYFQRYYNAANCFIIISGKYDCNVIKELNRVLGTKDWLGQPAPAFNHHREKDPNMESYLPIADSVQSSVMVGNASILKSDPDFDELTVLNTLFGGYFGSRLMSNIREDKGYTYGIYSSLSAYKQGTIFEIGAEVGKSHKDDTLREIKIEMQRLQSELVDEEELQTVKNYMSGRILRSVDGALRYSDVLKGLLLFDRKPESINSYLTTIQNISAERIQFLAKRYLDFEKMYRVAVG
jgi:predicted Zn-dependent peptidase